MLEAEASVDWYGLMAKTRGGIYVSKALEVKCLPQSSGNPKLVLS